MQDDETLPERPHPHPDVPTHLAGIVVLLLVTATLGYAVIKGPNPSGETVALIIGNVMGYGAAVVTYYFGSSRGSQRKDDALAAAASAGAVTTATNAGGTDVSNIQLQTDPKTGTATGTISPADEPLPPIPAPVSQPAAIPQTQDDGPEPVAPVLPVAAPSASAPVYPLVD